MNPLRQLQEHGQSVWLDYIRRDLVTSGELLRLVEEDGLRGVTSNPTIFEKAIAGSGDYDGALRAAIASGADPEPEALFEKLAVEDIRMAADVLAPVYDATAGADGFVSIEVRPDLAGDTARTVVEARRLWATVDRPNLMIKIPATSAGIPAIETLIGEGLNINVTLMFSLAHYEAVAGAYRRGLERARDPRRIASVASFFVSRVDTVVDAALEAVGGSEARALAGKIAVANAQRVYRRFQKIFLGSQFDRLRRRGARPQRPLWASTGTKNPRYSDVMYVERLIGPHTVNTMPPATLDAFRHHGRAAPALESGVEQADVELERLEELGIDLDRIAGQLQEEGVSAFAASFRKLIGALEEKRQTLASGEAEGPQWSLGPFRRPVDARVREWQDRCLARRIWARDHTVWSREPAPELTDRLGWLRLPEMMHAHAGELEAFAEEVRAEGIGHVMLLGMGGSSLAPEVFQDTFGSAPGYPELFVLDSTHPAAVDAAEKKVDLQKTLFLVSSKSGTTIEPLSLYRYFSRFAPPRQFAAITDPGTPLENLARKEGFRRVFPAPADVGGRYSALSVFGLVPAALIGIDTGRLLDRAWRMAEASAACVAARANPGLWLGAALGELAAGGRDKVTFWTAPPLDSFPSWLEQLVAESTGKDGKGIVPVPEEEPGAPEAYGNDRVFVAFELGAGDTDLSSRLEPLERAGHPVLRFHLPELWDLGGEFFRWEVAVAAAGAVLGIHPFNQPDVELAKRLARRAMTNAGSGATGGETASAGDRGRLERAVADWLSAARPADYIAVQAYLNPESETAARLRALKRSLRDRTRLAVTAGYGPRFLHSTGQLHKGGPNTGLFLQLIDEPTHDAAVPETGYTFGGLIRAQALGDYHALLERGRRVLRVNLGTDPRDGLRRLEEALGV